VKRAIEALQADAASAAIGREVLVILAFAATNGLARLASRFALIGGAQRVEAAIREDLYASLQTFTPAAFAVHSTGDLMARATSDVSGIRSLLGFGTVSLLGTVFAFVGAVAAMLAVDPWLTLWAMVPYPLLILLAARFNRMVHERTEAVQSQLGHLSARVQEHLAGMTVVRAYAMEPRAVAAFAGANAEFLRRSLGLARVQAQFTPLTALIGGAGTLVILWVGGRAVVDGRISLGGLVAFNGYLAYLAWPTLALGWTLAMVRRGLTSMERIEAITRARVVAPPARVAALPARADVRVEHLTFAYGDRAPVLRDVSLHVADGEVLAVVGPTGSGKTTLGLLLARLWEPPPGTVFVGGIDVRDLDPGALRAAVGHVPQESFLFSRSLVDNVTLGREGLGRDVVRAAMVSAGVAEEAEALPRGFDTVVGERGLTLSGGQRQRVALARALAGQPRLLVLDDVFASVDAAKEDEILLSLRALAAGRTVLLTTHRLRAARAADRIVVLVEGRVVEAGAHDDLVARGGVYARLWRIQQLEEEIARAG
jgi:ATP-binding cassette subfamily B protein